MSPGYPPQTRLFFIREYELAEHGNEREAGAYGRRKAKRGLLDEAAGFLTSRVLVAILRLWRDKIASKFLFMYVKPIRCEDVVRLNKATVKFQIFAVSILTIIC